MRDADRAIAPLEWYVKTGRASSAFLRLLVGAKPYMIGRKLWNNGNLGTDTEAVQRVQKYLGLV